MYVPIPERIPNGIKTPITVAWANSIRDAIWALANAKPREQSSNPPEFQKGQFAVTRKFDRITASAGILGGTEIEIVEELDPADGTWYLQAKIVIVEATGEIVTEEIVWLDALGTNTATDFYIEIASIEVVDGVPDSSTILQYNYGPLYVIPCGKTTSAWQVLIV